MDNYDLITKGFRVVRDALAPYIARELLIEYGQNWWDVAVMERLYDDQKRHLPTSGSFAEVTDALDIAICLTLFDIHWNQVFKKKLSVDYRTWAKELHGVRNTWAHAGGDESKFDDSYTWRALDTMSRLMGGIDPDDAGKEINDLAREAMYGSREGSIAAGSAQAPEPREDTTVAVSGLPSWRDVMQPHQDVAEGRYRNAEFAADLAQVQRGEGSFEYRDPVEFFSRTYVTEGMKGLLIQALRRVGHLDGEPVIQLKTAFGGGKTHSMLALYHLLRSKKQIAEIPNALAVVKESGIDELPDVKVAVLVGTALNPTKARRPNDMPGITINTLWGEMVAQLAKASGDPNLYEYIREADRKGVSPGSEALKDIFDSCGPCLILMDELVAYAKKLYGAEGLPAGTFDNFITFIQEVTEAARASRDSLVVASIPESNIEVGGEAGQQALEAIEHTFGRMEAIWKPVTASEGFEVVRRRLFLDCKDPAQRDAVCNAYSRMYNENATDFPVQARELDYRDRMVSCYPIHPEVFDRLYEDWATLERFQRTRGVLRLMAGVIHELWMSQDPSPMIMPGSLPLDSAPVRDELTRHLDENWNGIVDSEIDGKKSLPYLKDKANPRYGKMMASRRVSRTIMLGSAPDVSGQNARGIEKTQLMLGVAQPGENVSVFTDALSTLQSSSSHLYSDAASNRFWYDTRPTLRKTMEDRAQQLSKDAVDYEVESRLKGLRKVAPISGLHVCPASSLDVPDEQTLRMVVLPPSAYHRQGVGESAAIVAATDILNNRGTAPRRFKNMLVFIACDGGMTASLEDAARKYLAWKSISDDRELLNLDVAQGREVDKSVSVAATTLQARVQEAYSWLLAPRIDLTAGSMDIVWDVDRIAGSNEDPVKKAARKLEQNEAAIQKWAPALLRMELDRILWRDKREIQVKRLWEYLCTYCYLPRLSSYSVLEDSIARGLDSDQYFGIAGGVAEDRYLDLSFGKPRTFINQSDFLVKPSLASDQIEREEEERRRKEEEKARAAAANQPVEIAWTAGNPEHGEEERGEEVVMPKPEPAPAPKTSQPREFFMTAPIDATRRGKTISNILNEVVDQLAAVSDAKVEIVLEVRAHSEAGFPTGTVRAVSENCSTLHIDDFGFNR